MGSNTSSRITARSILLMIRGIRKLMRATWYDQKTTYGQTRKKPQVGEQVPTGRVIHT
jgi:hypothetical protein